MFGDGIGVEDMTPEGRCLPHTRGPESPSTRAQPGLGMCLCDAGAGSCGWGQCSGWSPLSTQL